MKPIINQLKSIKGKGCRTKRALWLLERLAVSDVHLEKKHRRKILKLIA